MSAIVARAPLRISFGGGGTDLPSYYREHGGFVVSAAIDRYVYMLARSALDGRYRLKHLEWEEVDEAHQIRHPILRAALERHWNGRPLELASMADAPPGTGLGSSGAYTVCALKTLALAGGEDRPRGELAEQACEIEIDVLERTVGKQDQYVAAHGGLCAYRFDTDDSVRVEPLELEAETLAALRERFLLFYTGEVRSAADILGHQVRGTLSGDPDVERYLHRTKELARESAAALSAGELARVGELMNLAWENKRARSPAMAPPRVEELRSAALGAGATGAILMGAGGGGFLLAYSPAPERTRSAMEDAGAPELGFDLDTEGCTASRYP